MTNQMIHTPSYLATGTLGEYWFSAGATASINAGWYRSATSTRGEVTKVFSSVAGWTVGFLFKYATATGSAAVVLEFVDGATSHVDLRFNAGTGVFSVTRNGTVLLTSTTALSTNTEYYVEFQTVIADSPSGVAILKVDGVTDSVINSSTLDTRNAGNASADRIVFGFLSNNCLAEMKHMYVNDNAGGVDDTFWGPIAVASLTASSAGNKAQWTPSASTNVSNVDDTTVDGDTTYNSTATLNQIDSFVATDTGYASGTVKGVEWAAEARRTDASSTARVARVYRIGGTDYVGSDLGLSTTYRILTERTRVSPATTSAWTVSELDGMEIGYKRTAS